VAFSRTGPWTDVHALGLILAEVMTDEPPFSDPDPEAHLFEQVMSRRRPTPASKGRDVGPFEPIIAKALSLSPRDRFRNGNQLLAALEDAAAGRAASPATAVDASGDLAGVRGPRRVGRAAALAVVAGMALAGASWAFLGRGEPPGSGPPAARREPARAPATVIEPVPASATPAAPAPSVVADARPPASPARALRTGRRKGKGKGETRTNGVEAPGLVDVGDGRALFDDTK